MIRTVTKTSLMILIATSFTACGGGGGGSTTDNTAVETYVTGTFIDSPVVGLTVKCSSGKVQETDKYGQFTCKKGDNVEFYLGNIKIGTNDNTIEKNGQIFTPYTIYGDDSDNAVKLAQLLQTLDDDNDPTNNIKLDKTKVEAIDSIFDDDDVIPLNESGFDEVVEETIGEHLVSFDEAKKHLDETLNRFSNKEDSQDDDNTTSGDTTTGSDTTTGDDTTTGSDTTTGDDTTTGSDTVTGGDTTTGDDTTTGSDTVTGGDTTTGNDTTTGSDTVTGGDTTTGDDTTTGSDTTTGDDTTTGGDTVTGGDTTTGDDTTTGSDTSTGNTLEVPPTPPTV